jgi:hypothetical protein
MSDQLEAVSDALQWNSASFLFYLDSGNLLQAI